MTPGTGRPGGGRPGGTRNVVQGLLLIGRGRPEGLNEFDVSVQGFLASLAPWVAFLLVASLLVGLHDRPLDGLTNVAVALSWLLLPPVLAERLAWLWGRDQGWLRYATVTNWCTWLVPPAYAVVLAIASVALGVGLPREAAARLAVGLMCLYLLWLHYFLARNALSLPRVKAGLLVAFTIAGYFTLIGIEGLTGGEIWKLLNAH